MSSLDLSRSAAAQTSTSAPPSNAAVPSGNSAAASGNAAQPQDSGAHAATSAERGKVDASSSQTQASTSAPDRAASNAQARRSGVLIDNYSSVVSDSDTSEDEQPQQPGSLLGGINAKQIQSGETCLG